MTIKIPRPRTCQVVSTSHGRIIVQFTPPQSGTVILKRVDTALAKPKVYAALIQNDVDHHGELLSQAIFPPLLPGFYAITCPRSNTMIKLVEVMAGTKLEVPLNGGGYNWQMRDEKLLTASQPRRRARRRHLHDHAKADSNVYGQGIIVQRRLKEPAP